MRGLGTRISSFSDTLFGRSDDAAEPSARWPLRYLAVTLLVAAILVARRPDTVTKPQFWGEDGFLYFHDNLVLGFPHALGKFYVGFPHLGQRLVAFLGGLVPFAAAPRMYTTACLTITALGLASFALPAFRHLVRSDALRVLWCIGAACLPLERGIPAVQSGFELGTPANLGWWVAIWLALLSLMRVPARAWRVALLALGGVIAVFSTPLATVNAPFWVLRAWRGYRQGNRREFALGLVLLAALLLCIAVTGNLGANMSNRAPGAIELSVFDDPTGYLLWYLHLLSDRVAALVLAPGALDVVRAAGAEAIVALAVTGLLLAASFQANGRRLPTLAAALYFFAASLLLTVFGRLFWANQAVEDFPVRYTLLPGAALLLAVAIALDALPQRLARRALVLGTTTLLVWSFSPRFVLPAFRDQRWPFYAELLRKKLDEGSAEKLTIPINPPWSPLTFEAGELSRAKDR